MAIPSPLRAKLNRRLLQKRSAAAVAAALKEGARRLPPGALRTYLTKKARRKEACAAMQYHRLVTPKEQPSFVASSNSRACHTRDCTSCEPKRANALARDTIELFDYVWQIAPSSRVLLLTLTSRNRRIAGPRQMLLDHQKALKTFFGYHRILTSTLGQFGNIEITFENRNGQLFAHVHSHHLNLVDAAALSDHRYIRQAEYVALWQRALKASYKPIVDIRAIKGRDGLSTDPHSVRGAVREVCKYCVDTDSYIQHENGGLFVHPEIAVAFALATHRRRLSSMDRIFKEAKKLRAKARKAQAGAADQTVE